MRVTIVVAGRTFTLALERNTEPAPEPIHPRGDVFATTERADAFDYEIGPPIGFSPWKKPPM